MLLLALLLISSTHIHVSHDIAAHLQVPLVSMECSNFKNGETSVDINETVRITIVLSSVDIIFVIITVVVVVIIDINIVVIIYYH